MILAAASLVLAVLWIPLGVRFLRAWRGRRNPVSLAIFMTTLLLVYNNTLYALAALGHTSWMFFAVARHVFGLVVVVNFYLAFHWSDTRFADMRRHPKTTDEQHPSA